MEKLQSLFFRPFQNGIRSDIQAMRAVAVVAVILYHLWPHRFTGGFVGVDIFFVISGFLMTSHLVKGIESGGYQKGNRLRLLVDFYFKRIRRLLPAALVSLTGVLIIFWALFRQKTYLLSLTAEQVVASALFGQNWLLAHNAVDYLGQNNDVTPVEHFWSLSLEEQFYFIWPMLLLVSFLLGSQFENPRRRLLVVVAAFTLASLSYGVYLTSTSPAIAYFVTPARIWEISLGGVIALLPTLDGSAFNSSVISLRSVFRNLISCTGLTACLSGIFLIDSHKISFPGCWALIPTIGVGVLIWAGTERYPSQLTLLDRLASFRPMQFVGDISYSFYLWHFICIRAYYYHELYFGDRTFSVVEKVFIVLPASFILAVLSYYLIERTFLRIQNRSILMIVATLSLALVLVSAFAEYQYALKNGGRARIETNAKVDTAIESSFNKMPLGRNLCVGAIAIDEQEACGNPYGVLDVHLLDDVERDYDLAEEKHCDMDADENMEKLCYFGDPNSKKSILLWGDSHAMHFSDALDIAAKHRGYKLIIAVRSSCPPLEFDENDITIVHSNDTGFASQHAAGCIRRNNLVLNSNEFVQANLVVLASAYFSSSQANALHLFANNLTKLGDKNIRIIQDAPQIDKFPDSIAADDKNKTITMIRQGIVSVNKNDASSDEAFFESLDKAGAKYRKIETYVNFCKDDKCYLAVGNIPVYRNDGHVTGTYSKTLGPWFAAQLDRIP